VTKQNSSLVVRALRSHQGLFEVYSFFAPGAKLSTLAEIPRLEPGDDGKIAGFQRPQIRAHVRAIAEYLARGPALFPNAIILALAPGSRFVAARGTKPRHVDPLSSAGTLTIPIYARQPAAWIVDGQQRTLALAEANTKNFPVPVIAFVSGDLSVQRAQFILVNKARPLSPRLIDELLPEVDAPLPRDLTVRRIPSALCSALNESRDSPFHGLIKRPSSNLPSAVVTDSSLVRVMRRSIKDPRGALAAHLSPDGVADVDLMFRVMVMFWSAVREAFPSAWGLAAERSRLMHSAGIEAMGILMDQVMARAEGSGHGVVKETLFRIAPHCHWTSGRWDRLGRNWNEIQNTTRDVRMLANLLVSLEREASAHLS
jgi:DGQHR domain-containing protein